MHTTFVIGKSVGPSYEWKETSIVGNDYVS